MEIDMKSRLSKKSIALDNTPTKARDDTPTKSKSKRFQFLLNTHFMITGTIDDELVSNRTPQPKVEKLKARFSQEIPAKSLTRTAESLRTIVKNKMNRDIMAKSTPNFMLESQLERRASLKSALSVTSQALTREKTYNERPKEAKCLKKGQYWQTIDVEF